MKKNTFLLLFGLLFYVDSIAQKIIYPDKGDVKVIWSDSLKDYRFEVLQNKMQRTKIFESVLSAVNNNFNFKYDIFITFANLPHQYSYYDFKTRTIVINYQMIANFDAFFMADKNTDKTFAELQVINATIFYIYHYLGQALAMMYDIPIIGNEEESLDNFAVMLLVDGSEAGIKAILDTSMFMIKSGLDLAKKRKQEPPSNWEYYNPSIQRSYNLMCMAYGAEPKVNSGGGFIPNNMTNECKRRYLLSEKSWDTLLSSCLKDN